MFVKQNYTDNIELSYPILLKQFELLIEDEPDIIANLANASALLNQFLENINWVGFYINKNDVLVLGPFQGFPACIRIPFYKGVCGYAATTKQTVVVKNVNDFSSHIACDAATKSEIVIPIIDKKGFLFGVLDIDSPEFNRFSEIDKKYLEDFVGILSNKL